MKSLLNCKSLQKSTLITSFLRSSIYRQIVNELYVMAITSEETEDSAWLPGNNVVDTGEWINAIRIKIMGL